MPKIECNRQVSAPSQAPQRAGEGRRSYVVQGNTYIVDERYELLGQVGKGSYSFVCRARDTKTGQLVAVKKIFDVFDDLVDARRILREVVLLRYLGHHRNIASLLTIMRPREGVRDFRDLYLVLEHMDTDLHQVVRSTQPLTEAHRQWFIYQIFCALAFMHSKRVIHRDIKPGNLLLSRDCDLKVCDFGLARGGVHALATTGLDLTDYVVTRWYRPPEMLLMASYAGGIDLWSAGCVLGELVTRKAILPGRDYIHQLTLITDLIGVPDPGDVAFATSAEARQFVRNMKRKDVTGVLRAKLSQATPACFDLITKLLVFNPHKRISAVEAMEHPYLAEFAADDDGGMAAAAAEPAAACEEPDWKFDRCDVREDALRRELWREMEMLQEGGPAEGRRGSKDSSGSGQGLVGMAVSLLQRVGQSFSGSPPADAAAAAAGSGGNSPSD